MPQNDGPLNDRAGSVGQRRRKFFEDLIYEGGRRHTQHSPVLPDVWICYGVFPGQVQDLLLVPDWKTSPGELARDVKERLAADEGRELLAGPTAKSRPRVAFNQSSVAVGLWFDELVRVTLPLSHWWRNYLNRKEEKRPVERFRDPVERPLLKAELVQALADPDYDTAKGTFTADMIWLARLVGIIALANDPTFEEPTATAADLERLAGQPDVIVGGFFALLADLEDVDYERTASLWSVNLNRRTTASIYRSVPATKADAAQHLFQVRGKDIRWAVIDSGVDASHLAFRSREATPDGGELAHPEAFVKKKPVPRRGEKWTNHSRVLATYDFTVIRDLLSADVPEEVPEQLRQHVTVTALRKALKSKSGRFIDWELFEPVLRIPHEEGKYRPPADPHGTHVAGILAADWHATDHDAGGDPVVLEEADRPDHRTGVAPAAELYDLRALDEHGGDEFSIMAALQFVRHLNSRQDHMEIHGVNLSFAIHHDVSSFACGRTPVCEECTRVVGDGVVVVAAAGNSGRARYVTEAGQVDEGYRTVSITDPGNAEDVITVGSTHRSDPHSYGVSYFSSRGPTGDGRIKPDLVAPGEKIRSTIPGNREESLDGTSMSAPHVSGAAALLLDRNRELVGQPRRVKEILCSTATDLGRERYFQGAGMVDILRALQSI